MLYALTPDNRHVAATPNLRGRNCLCPSCQAPVIPHCGPLVSWHWAHRANDCDPWSEPESNWHLAWKRAAVADRGARVEVPLTYRGASHRADIVLSSGIVIELQHGYLAADEIVRRERFWVGTGHKLIWLYDANRFANHLHHGPRGFWWKHGARSMVTHTCPVWWHVGEEVWRIRLNEVRRDTGRRILGRVTAVSPVRDRFPSLDLRGHHRARPTSMLTDSLWHAVVEHEPGCPAIDLGESA